MKSTILVCCCILLFTPAFGKSYGYIPDTAAAIRIARSELAKVYGRRQIESEEPLTAGLKNGIWTVYGTLWCSDGKGGRTNRCVGRVAAIKIRQSDGKILSVQHTK
jgi:hypothetical protein